MLKAIVALLLFGACHITTSLVALLWLNRENLMNEQHMDNSLILTHPETSGIALLIGAVITIGLLIVTKIARKSAVSSLIKRPSKGYLPALGSIIVLAIGFSFVLSPFDLADNGTTELFNAMKNNPWCLLLLCVVGPLLEEFVFRESILRNLAIKTMPPLAAAAVSAFLFGIVHGNWAQIIPAAIIGFIFGLFYIRTGNLQLSAGAHILNNSMGVALMFFPEIETWTKGFSLPLCLVIGGLLVLSGMVLLNVWWKQSGPSRLIGKALQHPQETTSKI